jgi:pullulanase/glycogen debranching enzyme
LTGNLADYTFMSSSGAVVKGRDVDYNGSPAGYTADPQEAVTYVDAHDNETLFDALTYKLPASMSMADRVRMQTLSLATTSLSQGVAFVHAGSERLRSKSLDRNSYNSGDWFNRYLVDCKQGNGFGGGLPPAADNSSKWDYARPLLADPALRPGCDAIEDTRERYEEFVDIRTSSPLFRLGSLAEVQRRLTFPLSGASETPGVVTMSMSDKVGPDLDSRAESVTVVFNASDVAVTQTLPSLRQAKVELHRTQLRSSDPVVRKSSFDRQTGTLTVPARTVAVFVER